MLSLGQTPLLALPASLHLLWFPRYVTPGLSQSLWWGNCHVCHAGCIGFFQLLHAFCWFPSAVFCLLLGCSPSGLSLAQCGLPTGHSPSEVSPSVAERASSQEPPLSPAAFSTASPAPRLQEHHLSLKTPTCLSQATMCSSDGQQLRQVMGCFHMFQRRLCLALDSSWPPSTPVIPCYQTPGIYAQCTGSLPRLCSPSIDTPCCTFHFFSGLAF